MGVDSFSRPVVQAIRRLSSADHVSVVVGAGASVTANLPDWSLLIKRLLARPRLPHKTQDDLASVLLQSQGYLLGAEAAFDIGMAAKERKRRIARALFRSRSREDFAPRELHFALAELARKRGSDALQVLTTNYDDLLEQAFASSGLPYYSRYDHLDPRPAGAFAIQHLHGFLSRETRGRGFIESADLILSQSDYDRLYLQQNDWPGEAFGQAAARGPLLFVGTSLTDPNLIRYLHRIKDRQVGPQIQVLSRQGLRVSRELFPHLGDCLRTQWRKVNVEVVLVEDFADITSFVLELSAGAIHDYRPPSDRLRQLWAQVNRRFRDHQERFAHDLHRQFRRELEPLLGPEATLGLWLGDGQGDLVHFAANDRIHRSSKMLRRIPWRWDAGWAVTEAVSYGNRVLREIEKVKDAPESRVPEQPWKYEAAVPVWLGGIEGHPPVIAGALTAATVEDLPAATREKWGVTIEGLADRWQDILTDSLL